VPFLYQQTSSSLHPYLLIPSALFLAASQFAQRSWREPCHGSHRETPTAIGTNRGIDCDWSSKQKDFRPFGRRAEEDKVWTFTATARDGARRPNPWAPLGAGSSKITGPTLICNYNDGHRYRYRTTSDSEQSFRSLLNSYIPCVSHVLEIDRLQG
jgi:hypothetical protein